MCQKCPFFKASGVDKRPFPFYTFYGILNSQEVENVASLLRQGDTDMTTGSIPRHLIRFSIPLLIGNLFQQLYNTVDSIVVGNYVGHEALAAVGCTTPIVNMLIGLFVGLASGAGSVLRKSSSSRIFTLK